jgi:hypothetical protein
MQIVTLQIADNGIIKTINDDNINGAGESYESTVVYEFATNQKKIEFIYDLCIDIGLELGNSRSSSQIQINEGWGEDYQPTPEQIKNKIEELKSELQGLMPPKDE